MIARFWRATTRPGMGESYFDYLRETGLRDFRQTPGFRGALVLRGERDGAGDYVILSLWSDVEAVKRFAGNDPGRAVYYPEDGRYFPQSEMRDRLELLEVVAVEPLTAEGSDA
jgi:heme-degrading monooxygenase HmoA